MRALWIVLVGLLLVGCGSTSTDADLHQPPTLAPMTDPAQTIAPTGLRIPSIEVDSSDRWLPLGIQGQRGVPVVSPGKAGEIQVPDVKRSMQLGWYCPNGQPQCGAPSPGQVGPLVVVGHINGGGKAGVFLRLAKVKAGDQVEIDRADGQTTVYKVDRVQIIAKTEFPTAAVYGNTSAPQLRLITCGPNDLDRSIHNYRDQTIVYASFTDIHKT